MRLGGGICSPSGHRWFGILPGLQRVIFCIMELGLSGNLSIAPDMLLKEKTEGGSEIQKQESIIDEVNCVCVCVQIPLGAGWDYKANRCSSALHNICTLISAHKNA